MFCSFSFIIIYFVELITILSDVNFCFKIVSPVRFIITSNYLSESLTFSNNFKTKHAMRFVAKKLTMKDIRKMKNSVGKFIIKIMTTIIPSTINAVNSPDFSFLFILQTP